MVCLVLSSWFLWKDPLFHPLKQSHFALISKKGEETRLLVIEKREVRSKRSK